MTRLSVSRLFRLRVYARQSAFIEQRSDADGMVITARDNALNCGRGGGGGGGTGPRVRHVESGELCNFSRGPGQMGKFDCR